MSTWSTSLREVSRAEKSLVVVILLLSMGAFENLMVTGPVLAQNTGMIGMEILWAILYFIVIALTWRRCSNPVKMLLTMPALTAVVSFALCSALWSQHPMLTARRASALALTLLFAVYFASRFELKEQFRLLVIALSICIVLSFVFELLSLNPSMGTPGWYGVFEVKNQLGEIMCLGGIVFLFWKRLAPERGRWATLGFITSAALLVLSRAMTALLVFIVLLCLLPCLRWMLRRNPFIMLGGLLVLGVLTTEVMLYLMGHLVELTSVIGRDPQLTGRVPLWILSTVMALRQPWLGYGFSAFWLPDDPIVQRIWFLIRWKPPQAHNGFLELWLELGLIGAGLFLVIFGRYFFRAVSLVRQNSSADAAWPFTFLVFLFLINLTNSLFLQGNNIYSILFFSSVILISSQERTLRPTGNGIRPGLFRG